MYQPLFVDKLTGLCHCNYLPALHEPGIRDCLYNWDEPDDDGPDDMTVAKAVREERMSDERRSRAGQGRTRPARH